MDIKRLNNIFTLTLIKYFVLLTYVKERNISQIRVKFETQSKTEFLTLKFGGRNVIG